MHLLALITTHAIGGERFIVETRGRKQTAEVFPKLWRARRVISNKLAPDLRVVVLTALWKGVLVPKPHALLQVQLHTIMDLHVN